MTTRAIAAWLAAAAAAAGLGACSGQTKIVERTVTVPAVETSEESPATETSSPRSPQTDTAERRGDAATNKVCKLLSVEEVQQLTGYTVAVVEGLVPGFRGDLGCIWRLVPVDYGAPSFHIVWDQDTTDAATQVAYYRDLIKSGDREQVKGYGDVATMNASYIYILSGKHSLGLTYRVRQTATPADQRVNLALLKTLYARTGMK